MAEPNPIRGIWYAASREALPDAPCYGCRRGLRRAYVMEGDEIYYHHLVREGFTIDCVGTNWLVIRWCDEHSELLGIVDSRSALETDWDGRSDRC